ncbi:MAG: hypothetical protein H7263_01175, partial [Candidatus Sericytochromatia bacterium]|nr:hypothetical protein [Candidatus Sericytochromatia bacterium]
MKNNFGQYGTSIVAHHYFRTDINDRFLFGDNIKHVRYMSGIGASSSPGMLDYGVFDYKQPKLKQSDVPDFKDTQPGQDTPSNGQSVTGKGTYIIRGPGDLESILKNHQSGQYIDLRNSQMSPEVLAAWQRGEPVEVNLEQLAPERVNLLAP